jgi:DNA-binding transcriptional MocR family regulator
MVPAKQRIAAVQIKPEGGSGTIAERLECIRSAGEKYTSHRKLARQLGVSATAVGDALKTTERFQRWKSSGERRPGRIDAVPLSSRVADDLAAPTEDIELSEAHSDEQLEAALARVLDAASPEQRAEINAKDHAGQMHLAAQAIASFEDDNFYQRKEA